MHNIIFLQAAIAAGLLLFILYGLALLAGVPMLAGVFMKFIWRQQRKEEYIRSKAPYYKDPVYFIACLIVSALIVSIVFYWLIVLSDRIFPDLLRYS